MQANVLKRIAAHDKKEWRLPIAPENYREQIDYNIEISIDPAVTSNESLLTSLSTESKEFNETMSNNGYG